MVKAQPAPPEWKGMEPKERGALTRIKKWLPAMVKNKNFMKLWTTEGPISYSTLFGTIPIKQRTASNAVNTKYTSLLRWELILEIEGDPEHLLINKPKWNQLFPEITEQIKVHTSALRLLFVIYYFMKKHANIEFSDEYVRDTIIPNFNKDQEELAKRLGKKRGEKGDKNKEPEEQPEDQFNTKIKIQPLLSELENEKYLGEEGVVNIIYFLNIKRIDQEKLFEGKRLCKDKTLAFDDLESQHDKLILNMQSTKRDKDGRDGTVVDQKRSLARVWHETRTWDTLPGIFTNVKGAAGTREQRILRFLQFGLFVQPDETKDEFKINPKRWRELFRPKLIDEIEAQAKAINGNEEDAPSLEEGKNNKNSTNATSPRKNSGLSDAAYNLILIIYIMRRENEELNKQALVLRTIRYNGGRFNHLALHEKYKVESLAGKSPEIVKSSLDPPIEELTTQKYLLSEKKDSYFIDTDKIEKENLFKELTDEGLTLGREE